MKRFIFKTILFLTLMLLSIGLYESQRLHRDPRRQAPEVFDAIAVSCTKTPYKFVIVGDSVAHQFFSPKQQSASTNIAYMASNQAITCLGSYLLVANYLKHNPQTKKVVYIVIPSSLSNNMNRKFSYKYFVIPFFNSEFEHLIEPETKEMIYHKFGKAFVRSRFLKRLLCDDIFLMTRYLKYVETRKPEEAVRGYSDLTYRYLLKMKLLCASKGIKLQVVSGPVPSTERQALSVYRDRFPEALADVLHGYIEGVTFFPADAFRDGVHFKRDFLAEHAEDIGKVLLEKCEIYTSLLESQEKK